MGGRGVFRRGGVNKAPLWIFLNTGGANSGIHIVKIYFLYCIFPPFLFYFLAGDKTRSYNRSFLFKMFYSPKRLNFVTFYWTTGGWAEKTPPRVLENSTQALENPTQGFGKLQNFHEPWWDTFLDKQVSEENYFK